MYKKFFILSTFICLLSIGELLAQRNSVPTPRGSRQAVEESDGFTKENLFIEPQVGLSLNNNNFSFSLIPYFGYAFTQKIAAGIGGGYSMSKLVGLEDRLSIWQGSIFGQAQIIGEGVFGASSSIYLRAELGRVRSKLPGGFAIGNSGDNRVFTETILPVGGGVRMGTNGITLINVNVMYNLLHDSGNSVYDSPFIFQPSFRWYFLRKQ